MWCCLNKAIEVVESCAAIATRSFGRWDNTSKDTHMQVLKREIQRKATEPNLWTMVYSHITAALLETNLIWQGSTIRWTLLSSTFEETRAVEECDPPIAGTHPLVSHLKKRVHRPGLVGGIGIPSTYPQCLKLKSAAHHPHHKQCLHCNASPSWDAGWWSRTFLLPSRSHSPGLH